MNRGRGQKGSRGSDASFQRGGKNKRGASRGIASPPHSGKAGSSEKVESPTTLASQKESPETAAFSAPTGNFELATGKSIDVTSYENPDGGSLPLGMTFPTPQEFQETIEKVEAAGRLQSAPEGLDRPSPVQKGKQPDAAVKVPLPRATESTISPEETQSTQGQTTEPQFTWMVPKSEHAGAEVENLQPSNSGNVEISQTSAHEDVWTTPAEPEEPSEQEITDVLDNMARSVAEGHSTGDREEATPSDDGGVAESAISVALSDIDRTVGTMRSEIKALANQVEVLKTSAESLKVDNARMTDRIISLEGELRRSIGVERSIKARVERDSMASKAALTIVDESKAPKEIQDARSVLSQLTSADVISIGQIEGASTAKKPILSRD